MSKHPFFPDLSNLSIEELDKKYTELTNRYTICKKHNMGPNVENQILAMIESIIAEKDERFLEMNKAAEAKEKSKEIKKTNSHVVVDTDPIEVYKPDV
jgi:hypothetical protein